MSQAAEKLKSELLLLSVEERADLAHFLLHTLDDEEDADAEAAWDAELNRRLEEIKSGKVIGVPADQVLAEFRRKLS